MILSLYEGWQHRKEGLQDSEPQVGATDELVNEGPLGERLVAIGKRVCKRLQLMTVGRDREITFTEAMELRLKVHRPTGLVAREDLGEMLPDTEGLWRSTS